MLDKKVRNQTGIVNAEEAVCTSTLMVATESLHPVNTDRYPLEGSFGSSFFLKRGRL